MRAVGVADHGCGYAGVLHVEPAREVVFTLGLIEEHAERSGGLRVENLVAIETRAALNQCDGAASDPSSGVQANPLSPNAVTS